MKNICWRGKAFKKLSFGKTSKSAGRNYSGSITIFHRGGGSKRLQRRIDFKRNILSSGIVERIEYDPNRSSRIALIRWYNSGNNMFKPQENCFASCSAPFRPYFSYIIACDKLKSGDKILNLHAPGDKRKVRSTLDLNGIIETENLKLTQKIDSGTNVPLRLAPLGCFIHNIESYPGQGGKFVRAAGTFAQLVQKFDNNLCIIRLPSGMDKLLDSRCRASIGVVSNVSHNRRKLKKAGQSRWLGKRPVVRGVAMNPIDHPHGGGEGRSKGGRPSVSPWGKPTKGSYRKRKTVLRKQR